MQINTKIKFILYGIFITINFIYPQSEELIFHKVTIKDGLLQNSITTINEDSKGFIWFGTYAGLSRYDGYTINNYTFNARNNKTLNSNIITSIINISEDSLLIGTIYGLNIFDIRKNEFARLSKLNNKLSLSGRKIINLHKSKNGSVWVINDKGLNKFLLREDSLVNYPNQFSNNLKDIIEDGNSNLWIPAGNALLKFDPSKKEFDKYKINNKKIVFVSICEFSDNKFLVGTNNGIWIFDINSKNFVPINDTYSFIKDDLSSKWINKIAFMPNGKLWVSHYGISVIDFNKKQHNYYYEKIGENRGINHNVVSDLFIDSNGTIWLGTLGGGANYYNKSFQRFNLYQYNYGDPKCLSSPSLRGILVDNEDNLWVAGYSGLDKLNKERVKIKNYRFKYLKSGNKSIMSIYSIISDFNDPDIIWIGTIGDGLLKLDKKSDRAVYKISGKNNKRLKGKNVYSIIDDSKNNLWIGTERGLNKLNKKTDSFSFYTPGGENGYDIRILFLDSKGFIWAGTSEKGLLQFDPGKESFIHYLYNYEDSTSISSNTIFSITEDNAHNIWIGTSNGLNKYNPKTAEFKYYNTDNGLPDNSIYTILIDDDTSLWMGTNNGIAKFDYLNNYTQHFNMDDGLQSTEFNRGSSYKSKNGEFFFGGIKGLNSFYPAQIETDTNRTRVEITRLLVNNKPVEIGTNDNNKAILTESISHTKNMELEYDQNFINLEFASFPITIPTKIKYAYKLEGLDDDWNYIGHNRTAVYSGLSPGKYTFKVKCTNTDGIWNETPTELKITITPPLWLTTWAKIFYVLFGLSLIYFFERYRNGVQKKIIQEKEKVIEHEKKVIEQLKQVDKFKGNFLAQMSHEIRTPINTLLSFTSLLKEEVFNIVSDDLKSSFDSIKNAGNRITRTIDLLLNVSEIQSGSYDYKKVDFYLCRDVIDPIFREFHTLAKMKNVELILHQQTDDCKIRADQYSVSQIFANLIGNAIKYTQKGKIIISIELIDNKIIKVKVQDTGIGISEEFLPKLFLPFAQEEEGYTRKYEGSGLGLTLVKNYCDINNIEVTVTSKKGHGTTFTLVFKKIK